MESYWFAARPFQPVPVPIFTGLPGGSPSHAPCLCGKAARTKCLGNGGLLQSHKHAAVCSRAAARAPQPARPPAALGSSWQKRATKPLRRLLCVRRRRRLSSRPLPTVRTCRSGGQFPGGRHGHRHALSSLSPRKSPVRGHAVPGRQHRRDSLPLTSPRVGLQ